MKTRELIAKLQEQDPSGELDVTVGNHPIYLVEKQPAYWDGPKHELIQDSSKPGYNIVGYKITDLGFKIKLHMYDLECYLTDNPDGLVDISGLAFEKANKVREFMKKFKEDTDYYIDQMSSFEEEQNGIRKKD